MFCFKHDWVGFDTVVTVNKISILFKKEWSEEKMLIYRRCKKCNKEKGYFEDMDGTKENVSIAWIKNRFFYNLSKDE